ncbi:hypothetical protein AB0C14_00565 [Microbispora hainanensis]|uniref:hypothetical protein n=1 Tax=Microbispora hainanensis TaxID=568844 RepID=UPI0034080497
MSSASPIAAYGASGGSSSPAAPAGSSAPVTVTSKAGWGTAAGIAQYAGVTVGG